MSWETRKETVTKREVRTFKTVNGNLVDDIYNSSIERNVDNGLNTNRSMELPNSFNVGTNYNEGNRSYEGMPSSFSESEPSFVGRTMEASSGNDQRSGASTPIKKSSVTLQMGSRRTSDSSTSSTKEREKQATYNMTMRLGEVNGPGTDGNVYIQLLGEKGNTAKIQLRQSGDVKNKFETDELYKFTVGTVDIGKIEKIKLTHDHMNYGSEFFVKDFEIDVPQHDEHYRFACNCWLSQDPKGEYLSKTVPRDLSAKTTLPNERYTISVKLGEVGNPLTKLFVRLVGDKGESSKIVLRPAGGHLEKFEEGKVYKFTVEMPEVGLVQKVHIGHDGSDGSDENGVFIEDIEVEVEGRESLYFPCESWVDDRTVGSSMELAFLPGPRPESSMVSENAHTVCVRLGEVHNPNVNLYICLIGSKGETPKVSLRPESLTLERNKTYKFTLAPTMDLGKIEKIRLGQDCRGYGNGLFVEEVEILPPQGPPLLFPCEVWLAEDVDDGETERILHPGWTMPKKENTSYYLVFKTGDMPYAGTDSNVSLQIFGERGKTERIMLRQQKGKTLQRFDKGRTDKFTVQTMDVGKVERIRLSHDNQGENPEWYLEDLFIEVPNPQGGEDKYYFPCNTWLKGPKKDRRVVLELYPVSPQTQQKPQTIYTVSFRVGELTDPRTEFFLVLHGTHGDSGKIVLAPDDSGKFVPGQVYRVVLKTDDVGKINTIEAGQDKGNPLYVEEVEIFAADDDPVVFPLHCWVDDTEKEFQPGENIVPVMLDDLQTAPEPEPEPEPATREYTILYRLGEVSDPRTELYIRLFGNRGESGRLLLEPADDSRGLEEGKLYKVVVQNPDIGEIQKIHIGHGNQGPGRGLFVEEVEVKAEDGETVIFPCRCWLAEDKADGVLDRVLIPGETLTPLPENVLYNVAFETGDVPFAGTDANVFVEIYGENGDTGKIEFSRGDNQSSGRFERGRTDKFAVETPDMGKLNRIRVGHDNIGRNPEWFLKQITIDVPQRNENYIFPYNNWIAGEDVDLDPVDERSKADIYTIEMKLGEVYDPVSPIYVQLIGDKGESGEIQIKPGYGPNDRFESYKTYKVVAKVADIGKTKDVIVRQDETSTGVYIETIEIMNSRGESIVKPVKNWTSKMKSEDLIGVGEGGYREGSARQVSDIAYEIAFKTANEPDAGTDADVHFQLIGDQGETEKISLRDDEMIHFERGSTDKFRVETKDVGEIKKLRVGRDNRGNDPNWLLEKVIVDDLQRKVRYMFSCNNWLLGTDPEIELEPGAPADDGRGDVHYHIAITTGNEPNAGTDANVFLQLFGEGGQTKPFKLREAGDSTRFSRGRTDKFSKQDRDVGKLERVRITRDFHGKEPGWLLEKMIIFIPETNEEYVFDCNRWIDRNEPEFEIVPSPVADETETNLYTVAVKMDDVMDPMSNPFYQIYGVKGKTNKIYLRDGYSPRHQFKKGNTYKISEKCPDVGKITKLIVGDDSGHPGQILYLEEIQITNNSEDKTVFPSNCWLINDSQGNPVTLELIPGEPAAQDGVSYRMIMKTADRDNAGTDANVYFQFHGERGSTPKILLRDDTGAFKPFESGRADKFIVQTADVGKLESMVIGHDNQGVDPSWFLEEVEVDVLETGDHYLFPCGRWLHVNNGMDETEAILYPGKGRAPVDEGKIGTENDFLVGSPGVDGLLKEDLEYEVEFKTGDEPDTGTDSNVYFQLYGQNGETRRIDLRQDKNAKRFQRGKIDRFRFREDDIGKLERLTVGNDGTGKSPRWLLEEVVVYVIDRNERYIFKCNRWIEGPDSPFDLPVDSWGFYQMVGREPDIPDLLEYMQSDDHTKTIHAAVYLQHLCFQDEGVKARVRDLGGIEVLVGLLDHSHEKVRYAAACVLRNISYSTSTDENKIRIAECDGVVALMRMLQRTKEEQERQVILTIIRNLSGVQVLRLMILRECLHIFVVFILIPYSGWDKHKALRDPTVRDKQWSEVLEHVTRIVRNLSSAGSDARDYLREEEALIDCLVWIIRVSIKSKYYENKCLENSVCTLRNLSYRLESELDRDTYRDADLNMDSKAVKEQQSQGCFAGCGGSRKKKTSGQKPIDLQKGGVSGIELLWQPTTVNQYFLLLKESNNMDTLEGSAGAIHNITACSWNWSIKIRGDSRKAQIVPHLVRLLKRDYDPAIRASAICLRNLAVDPENKRIIGEKAIRDLAYRIPGVTETNPLVKEPTIASLMCAIYQLCIRNDKNARLLYKTDGIRKIVRIAKSTNTYSPRLVKTANQVLANLWSSRVLTEQIRKEGWEYNDNMAADYRKTPIDFEASSLPRSPVEDARMNLDRGPPNGYSRYGSESSEHMNQDIDTYERYQVGNARPRYGSDNSFRDRLPSDRQNKGWAVNNGYVGASRERISRSSEWSDSADQERSWVDSENREPPPYTSQSSFENAAYERTPKGKRGTITREHLEMEEYEPRSFASPARKSSSSSMQRDYNENQKPVSETPVIANGRQSTTGQETGEKKEKHLWL